MLYYEPPGYTRGTGALIDEMIDRAGGSNVAREMGLKGVAEIGFENVLALRPEVIVIPGSNHYIFISNRDQVEREMCAFLKQLAPANQ